MPSSISCSALANPAAICQSTNKRFSFFAPLRVAVSTSPGSSLSRGGEEDPRRTDSPTATSHPRPVNRALPRVSWIILKPEPAGFCAPAARSQRGAPAPHLSALMLCDWPRHERRSAASTPVLYRAPKGEPRRHRPARSPGFVTPRFLGTVLRTPGVFSGGARTARVTSPGTTSQRRGVAIPTRLSKRESRVPYSHVSSQTPRQARFASCLTGTF